MHRGAQERKRTHMHKPIANKNINYEHRLTMTNMQADKEPFRQAITDKRTNIIKIEQKVVHTRRFIPNPTGSPIVGLDSPHHRQAGPEGLDKGSCQHLLTNPPIACAKVGHYVIRGWWAHHCKHTSTQEQVHDEQGSKQGSKGVREQGSTQCQCSMFRVSHQNTQSMSKHMYDTTVHPLLPFSRRHDGNGRR